MTHGVGLDGYFKQEVTPVAGLFFKDADPILIELLKQGGIHFKEANISHDYPFGWRTGDPSIYYAKNAWYIRTTDISDRMVELNIKEIEFVAADDILLSYRIKPKLPELGKRYGKLVPAIRIALAECDGSALVEAHAAGEGFDLKIEDQTLSFSAEDVVVETECAEGYACAEEAGYLVELDTCLTEDLLVEGLARELVRTVQDARKQVGLEVSDRIILRIEGSDRVKRAREGFSHYLMNKTLATQWGDSDFVGAHSSDHTSGDDQMSGMTFDRHSPSATRPEHRHLAYCHPGL